LRWLPVAGAMAVIRYARHHGTKRLRVNESTSYIVDLRELAVLDAMRRGKILRRNSFEKLNPAIDDSDMPVKAPPWKPRVGCAMRPTSTYGRRR
jgi:hypothetical protein